MSREQTLWMPWVPCKYCMSVYFKLAGNSHKTVRLWSTFSTATSTGKKWFDAGSHQLYWTCAPRVWITLVRIIWFDLLRFCDLTVSFGYGASFMDCMISPADAHLIHQFQVTWSSSPAVVHHCTLALQSQTSILACSLWTKYGTSHTIILTKFTHTINSDLNDWSAPWDMSSLDSVPLSWNPTLLRKSSSSSERTLQVS